MARQEWMKAMLLARHQELRASIVWRGSERPDFLARTSDFSSLPALPFLLFCCHKNRQQETNKRGMVEPTAGTQACCFGSTGLGFYY